MNLGLHVFLDQSFQVFRLVAPILTCGGINVISAWQSGLAARLAIVAYFVIVLGLLWAWYRLPIHCPAEMCLGCLERTAERISFWKVLVTYRCNGCGRVHVRDLVNPDLEVTAGNW